MIPFEKVGLVLFHFTWQALVIALLTGTLLYILKKTSSKVRYILCCVSMALMIILPIYTVLTGAERVSPPQIQSFQKGLAPVNIKEVFYKGRLIGRQYRSNEIQMTSYKELEFLINKYTPHISLIWLIGVLVMTSYRLYGFSKIRGLVCNTQAKIEQVWELKIKKLIIQAGIKQKIKIFQSPGINTPAVLGFLKPVILIPVSFFTGIESKYVEAIILHELAHIKRYDYLFNIIQVVVETAGFFHPAVWWISNKIRIERENCCDDFAIKVMGDRLIYVKSLVRLEEVRQSPSIMVTANGGNLLYRVSRLLNDNPDKYSASFINSVVPFIAILFLAGSMGFTLARFNGYGTWENFFNDNESVISSLNDDLVAYFPFNGNANDESRFKQKVYTHNVVLCKDRFGRVNRAFDFNGINSFINIDKKNAFNSSTSVTVCCWIYPRQVKNYESWISKAGADWNSQWRIGFGENENFEWGLTICNPVKGKNMWWDYWITKTRIPLNKWTYVAVSADQAQNIVSVYMNGEKIGGFQNLRPFEKLESQVFIGCQKDDNVFFNGKIDDIRIYKSVLTDDEISTLYKMN